MGDAMMPGGPIIGDHMMLGGPMGDPMMMLGGPMGDPMMMLGGPMGDIMMPVPGGPMGDPMMPGNSGHRRIQFSQPRWQAQASNAYANRFTYDSESQVGGGTTSVGRDPTDRPSSRSTGRGREFEDKPWDTYDDDELDDDDEVSHDE